MSSSAGRAGSSSTETTAVLILGAGPTGATLALVLAEHDVDSVRLSLRPADLADEPAGLATPDVSGDPVSAADPVGIAGRDDHTAAILERLGAAGGAAGLARAADASTRCHTARGQRVESIEPKDGGVVVAVGGPDGPTVWWEAKYVVDTETDGLTSGDIEHSDLPLGAAPAGLEPVRPLRTGRVLRAGPAAHVGLSADSALDLGIQDADNLGWKLAYLLTGAGGEALLESYDAERGPVAAEARRAPGSEGGARPRRRTGSRWRPASRPGSRPALRRGRPGDGLPEVATYRASPVVQPGSGGAAPDLPVVGTDGWRGPLRHLRGGPVIVLAIGPTPEEAQALAAAVQHALKPEAASLPPYRFVAGAAADATTGHDTAGTALGNLLVIRPDGHVSWKVNGENAPADVAVALAHALTRTVGR